MQVRFFSMMCAMALIGAVCACKPDDKTSDLKALSTPALRIEQQGDDSFTLAWDAVENATGYTYVVNEGQSITTTETSIGFTYLEAGTYVVKVKANAPAGSDELKDSEYASKSVEIKGSAEDPNALLKFKITDITHNSCVVTTTPKDDNVAYFSDLMTKAEYDEMGSDEDVIAYYLEYVSWMADIYGMTVYEYATRGVDVYTFNDLETEAVYRAYAFAVNEDGTVASEMYIKDFKTTPMPDADPKLLEWEGEWAATSTKTMQWFKTDKDEDCQLLDTPTTATLVAKVNPDETSELYIYGWTYLKDTPAVARLNKDKTALEVYAGEIVGEDDEEGYCPIWMHYSYYSDDQEYWLDYGEVPAYRFTMDGNTAKGVTLECSETYEDTGETVTFQVAHIGVYAYAMWVGFKLYEPEGGFPINLMAGDITLTRVDGKAQSNIAPLRLRARASQLHQTR